MFPSTVDRVPNHTSQAVNQEIRERTEDSVARTAAAGPGAIRRRLAELDQEWDIERVLEANAASISLVGLALGATLNKKLLVLPAAVAGFLLQHALQGWCPPIGLFRRLGFRTQAEIEQERFALKALRGDFQHVRAGGGQPADVERTLRAVRS
ncbi:MAG: DUF2892 domain-containing protein [Planctomyces sp.]|nr:DUF2892 domain-containing protein [Planctomyces sp.]